MNDDTRLGMTLDWWISFRSQKPVREAIIAAFLHHWLPVVENAIRENKQHNRTPGTWDQLATTLERNFASIWRTKTGRVKLSWYDAELLAEILDLRIEQLTPQRREWLPVATHLLLHGTSCATSPDCPAPDAKAYAMYRMSGVPFNPHLKEETLEGIRSRLPSDFSNQKDVGDAVLETAEQIGALLRVHLGASI